MRSACSTSGSISCSISDSILGCPAGSVKPAANHRSVRIGLENQGYLRHRDVYLELQKRLGDRVRTVLRAKYDLELETIPLETPPDLQFGELATPIAFELARKLRKAPKIIAQEIVTGLGGLEGLAGFAGFEVAGAGYIN